MDDKEIAGKKLQKIASSKELSTSIQNLETKKQEMEGDLKGEARYFFENIKPINLLNRTLRNVRGSSPSNYPLFKEAAAFGAGYLSKRKLVHQLKSAFTKTFTNSLNRYNLSVEIAADDRQDNEITDDSTDNEKENNYMDLQIEKVKAKPEVLPAPTYWPFFLALGIVFLGWGLLTTWLFSVAGFIIMIVSLIGWINILRHE